MSKIAALYSPSTGMIGCVIIQAAFKYDRTATNLFPTEDWFTAPVDDMIALSATREEWQMVARMSREERIERWKGLQNA